MVSYNTDTNNKAFRNFLNANSDNQKSKEEVILIRGNAAKTIALIETSELNIAIADMCYKYFLATDIKDINNFTEQFQESQKVLQNPKSSSPATVETKPGYELHSAFVSSDLLTKYSGQIQFGPADENINEALKKANGTKELANKSNFLTKILSLAPDFIAEKIEIVKEAKEVENAKKLINSTKKELGTNSSNTSIQDTKNPISEELKSHLGAIAGTILLKNTKLEAQNYLQIPDVKSALEKQGKTAHTDRGNSAEMLAAAQQDVKYAITAAKNGELDSQKGTGAGQNQGQQRHNANSSPRSR